MRKELSPTTIAEFEQRFGTFHDAVIHKVEFELFSRSEPYTVKITVGTQDLTLDPPDHWINLTFEIIGATKFILEKGRRYNVSIIFHLNIDFFDDEIYLDFFPFTEDPTSPDDYWNIEGRGTSIFTIAGKRCYWQESPYKANEEG